MFSKKILCSFFFSFLLLYFIFSKEEQYVISFSVPDKDVKLELLAFHYTEGYLIRFNFMKSDELYFSKVIDAVEHLENFYKKYSEMALSYNGVIFLKNDYKELIFEWGNWNNFEHFPCTKYIGVGYISTVLLDSNKDNIPDQEFMTILQCGRFSYHPDYLVREDVNFDGIFDIVWRKTNSSYRYKNPKYICSQVDYPLQIFKNKSKKDKLAILMRFIEMDRVTSENIVSFCLRSQDEQIVLYGAILAGRIRHISRLEGKSVIQRLVNILKKGKKYLKLKKEIRKSFVDLQRVVDALVSKSLRGEESLVDKNSDYHYYKQLLDDIEKEIDPK